MAPPSPGSTQQDSASLEARLAERDRQVRGLLYLALAVIAFVFWRTGLDRIFTPGWWRLW